MKLIALTQGQFAAVDDSDFDWLSAWKWQAQYDPTTKGYYAARSEGPKGNRKRIIMHRQILGLTHGDGLQGDHINLDTLDNRRQNLRIATQSQNAKNHRKQRNNASGYKGVSWCSAAGMWMARCSVNGDRRYLGVFPDKESAYFAYVNAAKEHHGEFARL